MVTRYMKRCSTLLTTSKMQLKTTMRHNLTLVRMTIVKMSTCNKCWRRYVEKQILIYYLRECKLVQSLWRTVWRLLKKLNIKLPYPPATPLLDIWQEKMETLKRCMRPNVHSSTVYRHGSNLNVSQQKTG